MLVVLVEICFVWGQDFGSTAHVAKLQATAKSGTFWGHANRNARDLTASPPMTAYSVTPDKSVVTQCLRTCRDMAQNPSEGSRGRGFKFNGEPETVLPYSARSQRFGTRTGR